jgi:hypothetical protein
VNEEIYDPEFDYIGHKKARKCKDGEKKTWRDWYVKKPKKVPEDIVPYRERNLKRVPIIAVNIETEEETFFETLSDSYKLFLPKKIYKCINNSFGKYKHRGHFFKRVSS